MPVIIHCRGEGAHQDCLNQLRRVLAKEHPVHCHCFTGSLSELKQWMEAFPNVAFGITGALARDRAVNNPVWWNAVVQMPLDKIILETDAPFLLPPDFEGQTTSSNPGMILGLAKHVADIKNLPMKLLCRVTTRNASRLYRLE